MSEKYNGWENRNTWTVNLWLANDEGTESWIRENAEEIVEDAEEDAEKFQLAITLGNRIEEYVNEMLVYNYPNYLSATMFSDLMGYALAIVHYYDIALPYIKEAWEELK